ncbi:hypothetical protein EDC04DRAFT_2939600, partial [Pisolithus marmoratus]
MPTFARRLPPLNGAITLPMPDDRMDMDDNDLADDHHRGSPALIAIGSQIYNSLSHRVRNEAKFHSVQLGMLTSTLAGSGNKTASGHRHWEKRMEFCDAGLPHVRYSQKVSGGGQPQALRFENTYTLRVFRLHPDLRNGRSIYDHILCPLLKNWSHPSVLSPIKDVLGVFQPDIIPEFFKCATYPITSLLEIIWKKHAEDLAHHRYIDPCTIEVTSMLECTLNYAHTGNAAVLCKRLMDRMWLSLGLLNDGFPALSDTFIAHGALGMGMITIHHDSWPVEAGTRRPLTSSKRAQQLSYGHAQYEAYEAHFTIQLAIENIPNDVYRDMQEPSFRLACYAADVALRVYFKDVKTLVNKSVTTQLNPLLNNADRAIRQSTHDRLTALSRWLDERYPLSYIPGVLSNLLHAVVAPNNGQFQLMPSVLGKKPVAFFAERIIKQCTREDSR